MLTVKQLIKASAMMDKMDISITNPKASQEEVGADLILQIVKKLHKAEKEMIEFIHSVKKCNTEEAENMDAIEVVKEYFDFFKSAVK